MSDPKEVVFKTVLGAMVDADDTLKDQELIDTAMGAINAYCIKFGVKDEKAEQEKKEAIEWGRVSVLRDFDNMMAADAFVGFEPEEWAAIKKFFAFNKEITHWDKDEAPKA